MIEFKVSSFCTGGGCVEVGHAADGLTAVRDAKDPQRTVTLTFGEAAWRQFLYSVRSGEFGSAR